MVERVRSTAVRGAIRPTTAMVLAAGHGTRLRPLTLERPKPLLEVLGRPLAAYALDHAARMGATRAILNTHHLGTKISRHFGAHQTTASGQLALTYSPEKTLLGTGGGLRKMWHRLLDAAPVEGPVLILNADALIDLDTDALVKAFSHSAPSPLSVMVLKEHPDANAYGMIGTDAQRRVVHFAGRANAPGDVDIVHQRMFCGVHLVDPAMFDMVPPPPYGDGGVCINRVGYPPAIASDEVVRSVDHRGIFWDVGTPERLLEANLRLLGRHDRLVHLDPFAGLKRHRVDDSLQRSLPIAAGAPSSRGDFGEDVTIHPQARVVGPVLIRAGARIDANAIVGPYAVVGPRAHIRSGVDLAYSVVHSDVTVASGREVHGGILASKTEAFVPHGVVTRSLARETLAKGRGQ